MPNIVNLHWDEHNEEHATRHGVSRREIDEMIALRRWIMVGDTKRRTGNRRIIGPTSRRRLLTLAVEWLGTTGEYRPITCWPSTAKETALYWQRKRT